MVTILIVEDSSFMGKIIRDSLKAGGYNDIILTENADQALEKLNEVKPGFILIDYFMPGSSGRKLCEDIRKNEKLKDVKIAFLTSAEFSKQGEEDLKDLNVLDYIRKPIEKVDFLNRIKKIIES